MIVKIMPVISYIFAVKLLLSILLYMCAGKLITNGAFFCFSFQLNKVNHWILLV